MIMIIMIIIIINTHRYVNYKKYHFRYLLSFKVLNKKNYFTLPSLIYFFYFFKKKKKKKMYKTNFIYFIY